MGALKILRNEILSVSPTKPFSCVQISADALTAGETYTVSWGCREIDSPDRGRRDSYESRLLLKFILEKEKKMANDNHLSLRSML